MLTFRGSILLGASTVLLIVGMVIVDGVLITLGFAGLLLLCGILVLARRNLKHLAVHLCAPPRIYAETAFDLYLTLENKRFLLDAFRLGLDLKLARGARLQSEARWTATHSHSTLKLRGSIPFRGAHTEHDFTLRSSFPLDLIQATVSGATRREILVYPRSITPREFFTDGAMHDSSLLAGMTLGNAPGEPRGIRPWQPGDPAKYIHWPASARAFSRRQGLRIRENDPPGFHPQSCTVIFHSYGTTGELIREDRFERALSLTCGTLHHLRQHGIPSFLVADFLDWRPLAIQSRGGIGEALAALAHARRAAGTEAHDLQAAVDSVPTRHSLILISDMPPHAWATALPGRPGLVIDIRQHRRPPASLLTSRQTSHA